MGICPGQTPIAMSPFCFLRVKSAPSDEDSAFCGVLAGLIQSIIAISNVNYAFSTKLRFRQPLKSEDEKVPKVNFFRVQDIMNP